MIEISKKNIRIWSMLGMRRMIGPILMDLAKQDEQLLFATADLGRYFAYEDLLRTYPDKVINFGIAEQNLIGASAALASEGFHVYAATYATFITARVLDQIRVNMGMMNLGIKLIGAAGGMGDGNFSATHMALEDFADLRPIPNITILAPADGMELVKIMIASNKMTTPLYIRLTGRANLPIIYKEDYEFEIGRAVCLKEGKDVAIISNGTILSVCLEAANELEAVGISCKIINMHTVKPLDIDSLRKISHFKLIVTVEEHMKYGGLGSAVAEYFAESKRKPFHRFISVGDKYPLPNEYESLLSNCGMTKEHIMSTIKDDLAFIEDKNIY